MTQSRPITATVVFARAVTVFLVVAIGSLLLPAALVAQVRLEVTPFFTSYYATRDLTFVNESNLERQEAGPGVGVSLTWRFTNIWAVEAQAAYVRSGVVVKNTGFVNFEPATDGRLLLFNGRVLFQPRRTNIYFALGAGTVARSGPAWDVTGIDNLSNVATIVGFGIRARVSPTWGFRIGTELHMYESDPDRSNAYYQKRKQTDVLVSIGVPLALIGR